MPTAAPEQSGVQQMDNDHRMVTTARMRSRLALLIEEMANPQPRLFAGRVRFRDYNQVGGSPLKV